MSCFNLNSERAEFRLQTQKLESLCTVKPPGYSPGCQKLTASLLICVHSAGEKNRKIKSARGRKTAVEGTLLLNLESISELNLLASSFFVPLHARERRNGNIFRETRPYLLTVFAKDLKKTPPRTETQVSR